MIIILYGPNPVQAAGEVTRVSLRSSVPRRLTRSRAPLGWMGIDSAGQGAWRPTPVGADRGRELI